MLFSELEMMVGASRSGFVLTTEVLQNLHRIVIKDLYVCAGTIRRSNVVLVRKGIVDKDKHQPPEWERVPGFVDEMCQYVNANFGKSAIHLAAYLMWRHNWIHPFKGGNGRTSRGISYLVLNIRLGFNLPGVNTIMQQIEKARDPYYAALESADEADKKGALDVSQMEDLISNMLAAQLLSVHQKASQE